MSPALSEDTRTDMLRRRSAHAAAAANQWRPAEPPDHAEPRVKGEMWRAEDADPCEGEPPLPWLTGRSQ